MYKPREQRLEEALRQLVSYVSSRGHHHGCLSESLGHDPACDCGLYGTLFVADQALRVN